MSFVRGLHCVFCDSFYPVKTSDTCPRCGVTGILDVEYDYPAIARVLTGGSWPPGGERSHWRYRELLPCARTRRVPAVPVGWTPLTPAPSLARHLGLRTLYLKDDGRNATGSSEGPRQFHRAW